MCKLLNNWLYGNAFVDSFSTSKSKMFLATDLRFFLISRGSPDPILVLCDYLLIGFQDVSKCPLEENQFKNNYITFLINERLFKSKFCTRDGQVLKKKQLFLHSHEICQIISFWNVNSYCQSKGSFLQHREALYFFLPVHPPSVHCPEDAPGRAGTYLGRSRFEAGCLINQSSPCHS